MSEKGDLQVVMKAKDLCSYVLTVTQKSPKQFRFTFTTRLQNLSMDIITDLYLANDIYVKDMTDVDARARCKQRLDLQHKVLANTRLLAYIAQLSLENKAITKKQYEQIAMRCSEIVQMSIAWKRADERRLKL